MHSLRMRKIAIVLLALLAILASILVLVSEKTGPRQNPTKGVEPFDTTTAKTAKTQTITQESLQQIRSKLAGSTTPKPSPTTRSLGFKNALGSLRGRVLGLDEPRANAEVSLRLASLPKAAAWAPVSPESWQEQVVQTRADGVFVLEGVWFGRRYELRIQSKHGESYTDSNLYPVTQALGDTAFQDLGDLHLAQNTILTGTITSSLPTVAANTKLRVLDAASGNVWFQEADNDRLFDRTAPMFFAEGGNYHLETGLHGLHYHVQIEGQLAEADGRFRLSLPPGTWILVVQPEPPHLPFARRLELGSQTEPIARRDLGEINIPTGREIRGRIVDASNEPVPGAAVLLAYDSGFDRRTAYLPKSDQGGRFHFISTSSRLATIGIHVEGKPWAFVDLEKDQEEVIIHLDPGYSIEVSVLDPQGVACDAELVLEAADYATRRINGAHINGPGEIDIEARVEPLARGQFKIDGLPQGKYLCIAKAGEFEASARIDLQKSTAIELKLGAVSPLLLTVRDCDGNPIRDARVAISAPSPYRTIWTDAEGRADCALNDHKMARIRVTHPAFVEKGMEVSLPSTAVEITLERWSMLRGKIVSTATDYSAWRITVEGERTGIAVERKAERSWRQQIPISRLGEFSLRCPPLQNCRITRVHDGLQTLTFQIDGQAPEDFAVLEGEEKQLTVEAEWTELVQLGMIKGQVVMNGVPGVNLFMTYTPAALGSTATLRTTSTGSFEFNCYDENFTLQLAIMTQVGKQKLLSRSYRFSKEPLLINIATGTISARVTDADDKPLSDAFLELWSRDKDQAFGYSVTDAAGEARWESVIAGPYVIGLNAHILGGGSKDFEVTESGESRVEFQALTGYTVQGSVDLSSLDADTEHNIKLWIHELPRKTVLLRETMSFDFSSIPQGLYTAVLRYSPRGKDKQAITLRRSLRVPESGLKNYRLVFEN